MSGFLQGFSCNFNFGILNTMFSSFLPLNSSYGFNPFTPYFNHSFIPFFTPSVNPFFNASFTPSYTPTFTPTFNPASFDIYNFNSTNIFNSYPILPSSEPQMFNNMMFNSVFDSYAPVLPVYDNVSFSTKTRTSDTSDTKSTTSETKTTEKSKKETKQPATTPKKETTQETAKTQTKQTKKTNVSVPQNRYWKNLTDDQMRAIYGDYDFDVTTKFNGTAEDLNKFLNKKKNSVLRGKGEVFMEAQRRYGINALALLAICGIETSYGTRGNAVNGLYNVCNIEKPKGATYSGRWRRFDSPDSAVMELARLLRENYVNSSGKEGVHLTKLYQINSKYCPVGETESNSDWAYKVNACLNDVKSGIA